MRANDKIVFSRMNCEIINGHNRQIALDARPMLTPINRHVDANLISKEEEFRSAVVFGDYIDRPTVWQACRNRTPTLSVVFCHKHIRGKVPIPMPIERGVSTPLGVSGRCDTTDVCAFGKSWNVIYYVFPCGSIIHGHLNISIVGTRPDFTEGYRRFINSGEVTVC